MRHDLSRFRGRQVENAFAKINDLPVDDLLQEFLIFAAGVPLNSTDQIPPEFIG